MNKLNLYDTATEILQKAAYLIYITRHDAVMGTGHTYYPHLMHAEEHEQRTSFKYAARLLDSCGFLTKDDAQWLVVQNIWKPESLERFEVNTTQPERA